MRLFAILILTCSLSFQAFSQNTIGDNDIQVRVLESYSETLHSGIYDITNDEALKLCDLTQLTYEGKAEQHSANMKKVNAWLEGVDWDVYYIKSLSMSKLDVGGTETLYVLSKK